MKFICYDECGEKKLLLSDSQMGIPIEEFMCDGCLKKICTGCAAQLEDTRCPVCRSGIVRDPSGLTPLFPFEFLEFSGLELEAKLRRENEELINQTVKK